MDPNRLIAVNRRLPGCPRFWPLPNNNLGFRVVLRSSHVLQPLLLVRPCGRDGAAALPCPVRSGNAGRSAQAVLPAEAKEEEQRQTGLVRAHAARQGEMRGIARAGRIAKPGHDQAASGRP